MVLGTRDGQSLSVTLLSSDMGKLYVALAQAIERLRDWSDHRSGPAEGQHLDPAVDEVEIEQAEQDRR